MMSAVERGFLATQIHAKYPIDKWEEEGAPFVSEEGWCELLAKNGSIATLSPRTLSNLPKRPTIKPSSNHTI